MSKECPPYLTVDKETVLKACREVIPREVPGLISIVVGGSRGKTAKRYPLDYLARPGSDWDIYAISDTAATAQEMIDLRTKLRSEHKVYVDVAIINEPYRAPHYEIWNRHAVDSTSSI